MTFNKSDILARVEAIGAQDTDAFDIGEAALLLAALDLPENNIADYRDQLDLIAADMKAASRDVDTLADRAAVLSDVLYRQHLYQGDVETYDDPQNANLMQVMDRRKGLPVALGILAIHAGRAVGWEVSGLNFPGHFLLRLGSAGEYAFIDPFDEARRVSGGDMQKIFMRLHGQQMPRQADLIRPVSDREILVRLQNNIKIRALNEGNRDRGIEILQTIALLIPRNVETLTELALLEASVGSIKSALGRIDDFHSRNPNPTHDQHLASLKAKLSRSLN